MAAMGTRPFYFQVRVDSITGEFLENCSRYGIERLFMGIESGNDRMLKLMNKKLSKALVLEKFKLLEKYPAVKVNAAFIIGFPTETVAEIRETIDFGLKLSAIKPTAHINYFDYTPFPGSDLYDLAVQEGFKPPADIDDWQYLQSTDGTAREVPWLSWATKETPRLLFLIDKYGNLLTRGASTSLVRTLGKEILAKFAEFRLRHFIFKFPWEVWVLFKFNRALAGYNRKLNPNRQ